MRGATPLAGIIRRGGEFVKKRGIVEGKAVEMVKKFMARGEDVGKVL
jgi:hypothetical protein